MARAETDSQYTAKLDELDYLLNDPDAPVRPDLVWSLLADIAAHDTAPQRHPG